MPFVLERVYSSALEPNRKWYACSDKFSSSQVVTGFTKELRRVEVENSNRVPRSRWMFALNFLYVFILGSFRRRAQDPQVGNSYRVSRLVYAPKISVFVSVNKFRTPLRVCRPVAIKYQTPLGISGTCFPEQQGTSRMKLIMNTLDVFNNIDSACPDGYFHLCWNERERERSRPTTFTNKTAITARPDGEFWLRESSGAEPPLGCAGRVCAGPVHLLLGWSCSPRVQASLRQAAHERGRRLVHPTTTCDDQPSGERTGERRKNPRRLRCVRQDAVRGAGNARYGLASKWSHFPTWIIL